jgi:AcrR family transcriptional regulator
MQEPLRQRRKTKAELQVVPPADRIRHCALEILRDGGPAALTTRAVCACAGVTAPTLYHHYGDKDGLLRAVAQAELLAMFARKQGMKSTGDALRDLKRGWDDWVEFAIEQPHLVRALQASGGATTQPLREAAEAIAAGRLARLATTTPLVLDPPTGARVLVAGANAVVQVLLDGLTVPEVRGLSTLLRDGLVSSLYASQVKSTSSRPKRGATQ